MSKHIVIGWKHKQGDVEGYKYDYISVYSVARMKPDDNTRGSAGIELKAESTLKDKFKVIDFTKGPVPCDLETEVFAKGKGASEEIVVNVTPLSPKP